MIKQLFQIFCNLVLQIEAERKFETEYIPPKARPCPEPPANSVSSVFNKPLEALKEVSQLIQHKSNKLVVPQVKLTTSAMLREHALYQKQLDEERQRLHAFEVDLRDDSDFKSWQVSPASSSELVLFLNIINNTGKHVTQYLISQLYLC